MSERTVHTIRARFWVTEVKETAGFQGVGVTLMPVVRPTPDNIEWSKYTPSGQLQMNVTDQGAADAFRAALRKDVLLTLEIVEPELPDPS